MKISKRNFLTGFVVGLIFMILALVGGGYLFIRSVTARTGNELQPVLQPPLFASQTRMEYNWRVLGLDGREFNLVDTKGKVIFLNFWATWCPPCTAEMPSIQRLYDMMKSEEIVFICVSAEKTTKVRQFVKERGFTFPVYTLIGKLPRVLRTPGIPATFITSPDGQIVFRHIGSAKWDDDTSIEFLRDLIRSKS